MKKILIIATMFATSAAFAGEGQKPAPAPAVVANATSVTTSTSVSAANGGQQQQQQQATNAGNNQTFAPVSNYAAPDVKAQGADAAAITAAAAIEIAKMQTSANGSRDLSADQQRALDREAMLEAARIGQTVKNTPGIVLGQLTSSNDTCMGSVSVGGSGPGFSIGVGTTYTDDNCKMLKNSRELWNMGMKAASLALMCKNADNREALELTGFECPQTAKARKEAEAKTAAAQPEVTDPIVRARLGLPELTASAK
jgi:hypothetical protein